MPKLKMTPTEKRNAHIWGLIGYYQRALGLNKEEVCLAAHFSRATYDRRREKPGDFTVSELEGLANKFHIKASDFLTGEGLPK